MKGFEGHSPEEPIKIDYEHGSDASLEQNNAAHAEGAPANVFDFEHAKTESEFDIIGRIGAIDAEIAKLREDATYLPIEMHSAVKQEMAFLQESRKKLETILKAKQRNEDLPMAA